MKFFPAATRTALDRRMLGEPDAPGAGPNGLRPVPAPEPWRRIAAAPLPGQRELYARLSSDGAAAAPGITLNGHRVLPEPAAPRRLAADAKRVLVVDDDPALREVLTKVLSGAGFNVCCASDGEEGWQALCTQDFDALVTDHDMPRLSGLDLLRRLRAGRRDFPVLFISGRMPWDQSDLVKLLPPGRALEKPFSMVDLIENIHGVLAAAPPLHGGNGTGNGNGEGNGSGPPPAAERNQTSTTNEAPWIR